jgi:hypothetical protein
MSLSSIEESHVVGMRYFTCIFQAVEKKVYTMLHNIITIIMMIIIYDGERKSCTHYDVVKDFEKQ